MPDRATSYTISPSGDSTLAIEISKTGLSRRKKHLLFFERFSGEMCFAENNPAAFKLTLSVDAASVVCRDDKLSEKKRRAISEFVRNNVLAATGHPEIRFTSNSIRAKALRGFVVEGTLKIRDTARTVEVSTVLSPRRADYFQIDGDATLRLSDFALPRPSTLFGLIGTKDEAPLRILLWGIPHANIIEAIL
jgi:polyisoprenoid-binding protein YceI